MENTNLLLVSETWKAAYPHGLFGVLAMRNVINPDYHAGLDQKRLDLESDLRSRFGDLTRKQIKSLASLQPYTLYYGRYGKTYHVQLQLESIVLKGKSLPRARALLEAMFLAELKSQLLTAGHDWDQIAEPLTLDVARGDERYVLLGGQEQAAKQGDMMVRDGSGIISTILYGPDSRTRIVPETRRVLFTVYGPPGVSAQAMEEHLGTLRSNVTLLAPDATVEFEQVYGAE